MEGKTSLYVRQKLERAGFDVQTFLGHHGLIAEIKGESSEVIAIRADMDALLQEIDGVGIATDRFLVDPSCDT
jgi:amidohydrolase